MPVPAPAPTPPPVALVGPAATDEVAPRRPVGPVLGAGLGMPSGRRTIANPASRQRASGRGAGAFDHPSGAFGLLGPEAAVPAPASAAPPAPTAAPPAVAATAAPPGPADDDAGPRLRYDFTGVLGTTGGVAPGPPEGSAPVMAPPSIAGPSAAPELSHTTALGSLRDELLRSGALGAAPEAAPVVATAPDASLVRGAAAPVVA